MESNNTKEIIKRVSKKLNLDEDLVKKIARTQYKFLKEKIEEHHHDPYNYNNIRLLGFGIFYVSHRHRKYLQDKYGNGKEKDLRSSGS